MTWCCVKSTQKVLERLTVIVVHYNPQKFNKRAQLVNECLSRLSKTKTRLAKDSTFDLNIVAAELIYHDDSSAKVQSEINPLKNVEIVCTVVPSGQVMWSKEQLINLVLRDLPEDEKYVAWIDSDVAFTDDSWVSKAISKLSLYPLAFGQLWSTCDMLGPDGNVQEGMTVKSFAQQKDEGKSYISCSNRQVNDYWHPGFAWCATMEALKRTNFLIDKTLGSADRHMAMSFLARAAETVPDNIHRNYKNQILEWERSVLENDIALILIPNHIVHHWHGSLKHRAYMGRWNLLAKHRFDPSKHLRWNEEKRLYYWHASCPQELQDDIIDYFQNRQEDSSEDEDIGGGNGDGIGDGFTDFDDGEGGQEITLDEQFGGAVILNEFATPEGDEGLVTSAGLTSLDYYA